MVEAQPLPSTSITLSPVHLILPIIEASAEFRLGRKLGVMGILGFGRVDEFSAFEIGAQGRFYLLGDFASGLNIALEAMYIGIETMPDVEVRGAAEGLAIGPLIGYKWVSSAGFTVDLQAGAEVMVVNAEASSGGSTAMSQSDDILPVLNLNLGWSF